MDKSKLLDMAKKVQSGEFLPRPKEEAKPVPSPNAASKQDAKARRSGPAKDADTKPAPANKRKIEPVEQVERSVPASLTPSAGPVPQSSASQPSEKDLYHKRLLSLGLPAYRQGIKFDVQPRRKRGRPPAPKLTPQELSDKQFLASLWAKHPPIQEKKRSMAGMPPRYSHAKLSNKELHWMRPIPMPLSIATQDPSGYRLPPSAIWRRWSETLFPS